MTSKLREDGSRGARVTRGLDVERGENKGAMNNATTIEEAAARIERELPGLWRWRVGMCKRSAHATLAPDERLDDAQYAFDKRFDSGFDADLYHTAAKTFTPAEALMAALEKAKAAVTAWEARQIKPMLQEAFRLSVSPSDTDKRRAYELYQDAGRIAWEVLRKAAP
ncbi:MAG: hypothetical protein J2P50_11080 [Hyphomicrobiaceae bacterium]|nr:hypothetical protein [Hyphomicrobiaceae bacterium]